MTSKIEIYTTPGGTDISVTLEEDTLWLDARLIGQLFEVNRPAIVKHIGNIYKAGELRKEATCSILEQVAAYLVYRLKQEGGVGSGKEVCSECPEPEGVMKNTYKKLFAFSRFDSGALSLLNELEVENG